MSRKLTLISELIEEISMGPFGSDIKVDSYVEEGVPVLNGSNLQGVKLCENSFNYVTPEKARTFRKAVAKRGDIVITHRGTLGQVSYIPFNSTFENYVISQSQFRVALKTELVNPIYFTYYFHTDEGQKRLLSFKSHVGVPALAQATTNFRLLEFPLISLNEQDNIVAVLSTLDAKIELNNCINTELEAMAKTLYDYWFVQFDFPNANGKPYKTSGGKMTYNAILKREIPERWSDTKLDDVLSRTGTGLNLRDNFKLGNGENYYITIKDIEQGKINFTDKSDRVNDEALAIIAKRSDLQKGDVLFTSIEPVGVTYLLHEKPKNWDINESVFTIRANTSKVTNEFLFMLLSGKELKSFTGNSSSGSIHKGIRHGVLKSYPFAYSGYDLIEKFTAIIKPILEKQHNIENENLELKNLRDWLLPMLMNGQVKVKQCLISVKT